MVKTYLITGFSGFVSWHFLEYLEIIQVKTKVVGIDVNVPNFDYSKFKYVKCEFKTVNLLDKKEVHSVLEKYKPNYILHLASYSSVAFSWENPYTSFTNNTNIFLNILEEVRLLNLDSKILSIGSSEEYGDVNIYDIPLKETSSLNPISPYAVARVSQEMLSKIYADGYGLNIIMTRSFNHIGIGQKENFVIPSFAKQLINIKNNKSDSILKVGDISIVRDFIDVRDVVNAYHKLFEYGKVGSVYNICSGKGNSLNQIILMMTKIIDIKVSIIVDEKIVRPNDNKIIIGCNEKLKTDTKWENKISIEQSLTDILNFYQ